MHARLGFSIAAHMDPDILLIDEALSVGDESFQRKCHERMQEFRARRKTIMIVSHNLAAVAALCDRVCLLVHGKVTSMGPPDLVLPQYQELAQSFRPSGDRPRLRAAQTIGTRP
jgi:ABC-type polysaccharide/polyol phosphate transport system ATPase subunit